MYRPKRCKAQEVHGLHCAGDLGNIESRNEPRNLTPFQSGNLSSSRSQDFLELGVNIKTIAEPCVDCAGAAEHARPGQSSEGMSGENVKAHRTGTCPESC
jgi:hypothetical protein